MIQYKYKIYSNQKGNHKMDKNILIIVDIQNGFIQTDETYAVYEKIKELLNQKIFDAVIATKFVNVQNSAFEKLMHWTQMMDKPSQSIPTDLHKYISCIIEKYTYTPSTHKLSHALYALNNTIPNKVFIVGVDTNACVAMTTTMLFENNIRPIVLTKYTASTGGVTSHKAGLLVMKRLIGNNQLIDLEPKSKSELNSI